MPPDEKMKTGEEGNSEEDPEGVKIVMVDLTGGQKRPLHRQAGPPQGIDCRAWYEDPEKGFARRTDPRR